MAITRIYADGEGQSRFGSFLIRMTGSGEHWYSIGCVCVRERDRQTKRWVKRIGRDQNDEDEKVCEI